VFSVIEVTPILTLYNNSSMELVKRYVYTCYLWSFMTIRPWSLSFLYWIIGLRTEFANVGVCLVLTLILKQLRHFQPKCAVVSVMFIVFIGSFVSSAKDFISFFIIISTEDDFKLFDY